MLSSSKIDAEALRRRIDPETLSFSFSRSGGPGGQNVNKVSTRATLQFDLKQCQDLTDEEKTTVRNRLTNRISQDGILQIVSSRHRTQSANREAATARLFELLEDALRPRTPRRRTRVPSSARLRRLREKKQVGERKRFRSKGAADE